MGGAMQAWMGWYMYFPKFDSYKYFHFMFMKHDEKYIERSLQFDALMIL